VTVETFRPQPRAVVPYIEPVPPETIRARIVKFLSPRTSPDRVPDIIGSGGGGIGFVAQNTVLARPLSAASWREYAKTPWVFAALNKRKDQVSSAEWDIVPFDNTKRFPARQRDALRDLFNQPSAKIDSFQSFAKVVIGELLTLDAAPIEKVRYPDGSIAELWPTRGDWVAVDERWDGSDPDKARYYWLPDGTIRAAFRNDDMVYMVANQRDPASSMGVSPIGVLQSVIDTELQGLEYNRRQIMGAAPDGALNIGESASTEDVQKAQSRFQSEVFGQSAMAIIGGFKSPSFMRFRDSNRDMQFRELEDLMIRCIAIVLGLAPMDLGITFDVNRSSAEQQSDNSADTGLRPLKALFQNFMTREIVWDKSFGGRGNNLSFQFADLSLDETMTKAGINKIALGSVGWKTINEARAVDGRAPLGDPQAEDNIFNHVLTNTPKGMLDLTTGTYVGEEALAKIAADAKIDVAEAVAEANPTPPPGAAPASAGGSNDE
jgi:phage portal protein BeeE